MTLKEKLNKNNLVANNLEKIAEEFAIGFAEWKDEYICQKCNGDGYTVEVEAECCRQRNDYCCGIPIPIQIQRGCYCNNTTTKELLEIYKKEKGL